jgi:transposase
LDGQINFIQQDYTDSQITKRWNFSDSFITAEALDALHGDKTVQGITPKRQLQPSRVSSCNRQAVKEWPDILRPGQER